MPAHYTSSSSKKKKKKKHMQEEKMRGEVGLQARNCP
jgi:hypothetical protein